MSSSRTLQSRVLALTGAGVFIAAAALSLLSRESLLALESRIGVERQNVARLAAGVLARDLVADLEVLQTIVSAPRLQGPDAEDAVWVRELAAASRGLRVGDGICRTGAAGAALHCGMNSLVTRIANPRLIVALREAISTRRAVVSPFVTQPDGTRDAIAVVPFPGTDQRGGAIVEVISGTGSAVQRLFTAENGLSLAVAVPPDDAAVTAVAGTPWLVSMTEPADVVNIIGRFRRRSLWFAPSLAALALVLAWGVVVSVRRPLAALIGSAERIAAGNLRDPVPGGSDEIGRLGTALENMRVRLKASIEDVERANAVLERRVEERTSQLQRLLGKIISAQEDERRRVARELHDETSQVLTALGMALHSPDAMAPDRIQETQALVERMHDGLHRLIMNLRPSTIDDLGLGAAIEALASSQLRCAGVSVRCELGDLRERRVDPAIEIAIFRAVQEAVLNIVRHSGASAVVIEGGLRSGRLWIEIEDDGRGFDQASIAPNDSSLRGVGLIGMRERVEMLGGRFTVDSAPGQGTRVHIDVRVTP
jgi:signal transduction histidine kinase